MPINVMRSGVPPIRRKTYISTTHQRRDVYVLRQMEQSSSQGHGGAAEGTGDGSAQSPGSTIGPGGPAGMPDDITAILTTELEKIVASDAFRDKMGALNYGVVWAGGEDFTEYLARRGEAFGAAISAAGLGQ